MNPIPELHLDALIEVFNIGACRAAASLSEIVGEEVKLSVPHIKFFNSSEISAEALSLHGDRLGDVSQHFSGHFNASSIPHHIPDRTADETLTKLPSNGSQVSPEHGRVVAGYPSHTGEDEHESLHYFHGDAMLLFTEERVMEIVRDMMGSQLSIEELAEFEQEAMCELGNIILNACMSSMADMLNITLNSSLPTYTVNSSEIIMQGITATATQPLMLALHVDLTIERRYSAGNIVFLLSSSSLQELLEQIDHFVSGI